MISQLLLGFAGFLLGQSSGGAQVERLDKTLFDFEEQSKKIQLLLQSLESTSSRHPYDEAVRAYDIAKYVAPYVRTLPQFNFLNAEYYPPALFTFTDVISHQDFPELVEWVNSLVANEMPRFNKEEDELIYLLRREALIRMYDQVTALQKTVQKRLTDEGLPPSIQVDGRLGDKTIAYANLIGEIKLDNIYHFFGLCVVVGGNGKQLIRGEVKNVSLDDLRNAIRLLFYGSADREEGPAYFAKLLEDKASGSIRFTAFDRKDHKFDFERALRELNFLLNQNISLGSAKGAENQTLYQQAIRSLRSYYNRSVTPAENGSDRFEFYKRLTEYRIVAINYLVSLWEGSPAMTSGGNAKYPFQPNSISDCTTFVYQIMRQVFPSKLTGAEVAKDIQSGWADCQADRYRHYLELETLFQYLHLQKDSSHCLPAGKRPPDEREVFRFLESGLVWIEAVGNHMRIVFPDLRSGVMMLAEATLPSVKVGVLPEIDKAYLKKLVAVCRIT